MKSVDPSDLSQQLLNGPQRGGARSTSFLDVIPYTLFRTLASAAHVRNVAVLERIFEEFFDDFAFTPKKTEVLQVIQEVLDHPDYRSLTDEDGSPTDTVDHVVYNRLREDGWIMEVVNRRTIEVYMPREAHAQRAVLAHAVDYVITIENPTSFWRYCTELAGNYLALLTDGFPARDVLSGMIHLVKSAREAAAVPIYHWGDIDAGGIRIAAHLEDAFGVRIKLHEMRVELAMKRGTPLQSRKGLDRLGQRVGEIGELARWLSSDQAKALEQEELDPRAPH